MTIIKNEKGIALVMVLIMALIGLAMVSALLFMVTQGTTLSGAMKFYRTADEAVVGAAEFTGEYITNRGLMAVLNAKSGCDCRLPADPDNLASYADNLDNSFMIPGPSCRCDKICNPTAQYNAGGSTLCPDEDAAAGLQVSVLMDPTTPSTYDRLVTLGAYTVTYKIVDTVEGNTDPASIVPSGRLSGSLGVVSSSGGVYSPPHFPFLYRVEVMAQKTTNPRERSRMSVLYGY